MGGAKVVKIRHRTLASTDRLAYHAHPLAPPVAVGQRSVRAAAASLSIGAGFPGLSDNGFYPADAQVAVGPSDIVEVTNALVGVYTRTGFRINTFPMAQILDTNRNADMSDPQIAWDTTSGRWIATGINVGTDTIDIAISDSSDPDGAWESYSVAYGSSACPDQPRLGFSSAVVILATEIFSGACHKNVTAVLGGVMLVIDKQAMLSGAASPATSQWGPSLTYQHYVPVQMLEPSSVDYVGSTDPGASRAVHVLESQGIPPDDTLTEQDSLLIAPLQDPGVNASQRGGGLIDAGDDRINDATWARNTLYLVADDRCTYQGDPYLETCARVIEINTGGTKPTLIGENDIGTASEDAYFAAIRPDSHGNAIIVLDYSGPHDWPSVAVTAAIGPVEGEEGGNFTQPLILAQGTSPAVERWGDYTGAAIDPTDPDIIWTAGQVADNFGDLTADAPARWATHIDAVSMTSALTSLPNEVYAGVIYRGHTRQHQTIQIRPSGGGAHIYNVWATVRMRCRRGGYDTVRFQLPNETRKTISTHGSFSTSAHYGAGRYAHSYSFSITGRFSDSYDVIGSLRASERDKKYGLCSSGPVSFSAHA
jgi:hypothetical protein